MIAFIDWRNVLTICKFRFEAIFIPRKYNVLCLTNIKKLMRIHNKETCTRVYTRICAHIDIGVYAKYVQFIIGVCVVHIYLSCTLATSCLYFVYSLCKIVDAFCIYLSCAVATSCLYFVYSLCEIVDAFWYVNRLVTLSFSC